MGSWPKAYSILVSEALTSSASPIAFPPSGPTELFLRFNCEGREERRNWGESGSHALWHTGRLRGRVAWIRAKASTDVSEALTLSASPIAFPPSTPMEL